MIRRLASCLDLLTPCLMGIVDLAPAANANGRRTREYHVAIAQGLALVRDGAAVLSVEGASMRQGSDLAPMAEEPYRLLLAAIEELSDRAGVPINVGATSAVVTRQALEAGAEMISDVTALRGDPAQVEVLAEAGCAVCLTHAYGIPGAVHEAPHRDNVVDEVLAFLEERMRFALARGMREEQLILDPGLGFGKTAEQDLTLLHHLDRLVALGRPVLVGAPREQLLGAVLRSGLEACPAGPAVTTMLGVAAGVHIFRVREVRPNLETLRVALAARESASAT